MVLPPVGSNGWFPRPGRMRRCSSLSTSFVLAALRALQVDSSCVSGAEGRDRGNPQPVLAPAGGVVAGVIADQRIGDPGAAMRQGAADDSAVLTT